MKLAFLHSCLEPGRDGVGDYVHLLAQECARQGHDCCLVGLRDRAVSEPLATQSEVCGRKIVQLRLPAAAPWPERTARAKALLDEFGPDWVSLQFVPYAFHPKGFVHGLERWLRPLVEGRRLQIMFHELWLGEALTSSSKDRLIGSLQKRLILRLLKQLRPSVVHTSNDSYAAIMQESGIAARLLPLFGNIPVSCRKGDEWLFPLLQEAGMEITPVDRSRFLLFGFFGSLPSAWPPEPFFTVLHQKAVESECRVAMLSIGQLGAGEARWKELADEYASRFVFCRLGPQPAEKVSEYLNSLDYGVATSPLSLVGKSSAVAAMWDHGLPVIVNRDDIRLRCRKTAFLQFQEPLLCTPGDSFWENFPRTARRPSLSRLPAVAGAMLKDFAASDKDQAVCH